MTKTLVCSLLSLALMPAFVNAATDTDRVKVLVKQKMSIEADSVTRLPSGLYEVVADRNLLYVDKDVKYFFSGYIFDIATQKNLTRGFSFFSKLFQYLICPIYSKNKFITRNCFAHMSSSQIMLHILFWEKF